MTRTGDKRDETSGLAGATRQPYDGSDVTWNARRLASEPCGDGAEVRIFLVDDAVDLGRASTRTPEGSVDLVQMTKELLAGGVVVKACGTCIRRCGINKGGGYYEGVQKSNMADFSQWVLRSDKVLSFWGSLLP